MSKKYSVLEKSLDCTIFDIDGNFYLKFNSRDCLTMPIKKESLDLLLGRSIIREIEKNKTIFEPRTLHNHNVEI